MTENVIRLLKLDDDVRDRLIENTRREYEEKGWGEPSEKLIADMGHFKISDALNSYFNAVGATTNDERNQYLRETLFTYEAQR